MIFIKGLFVISAFFLSSSSAQITVKSVFVPIGSDAIIPIINQSSFQYIQVIQYNPKALLLDSRNISNNPPNYRYMFKVDSGNWIFHVLSVTAKDGRGYYIRSNFDNDAIFNIIVTNLLPPSLISTNNNFSVGNMATANCTIHWYGSDEGDQLYSAPLSTEELPKLGMMIGSNKHSVINGLKLLPDSRDKYYHFYTLSENLTIKADWVGKNITCLIESSLLLTPINSTMMIQLDYATANIFISSHRNGTNETNFYNVRDSVDCTADGYPSPMVSWVKINLPPGCDQREGVQSKSRAKLYFECEGPQTWNCTAINTVNGMQRVLSKSYFFNVGYYTENQQPSKNADNSNAVGLGVGLGIGLGVPLLIGLIALCCCLAKKKKVPTATLR